MDIRERLAGLSPKQRALVLQKLKQRKVIDSPEPTRINPRGTGVEVPLSYAQQALWFLDQLETDSATYNVTSSLRLNGLLDSAALEQALHQVIERHEALRTHIVQTDDGARQIISPQLELPLGFLDFSGLPIPEREAAALTCAEAEGNRPFDLTRGPLIRYCLFRIDAREHLLVLNMHHIISDGSSLGILAGELEQYYHAALFGECLRLPALTIQFGDYASWQRAYLSGDVLEQEVAWWRKALAGAPDLTELPTDFPRPARVSSEGGVCSFSLDVEATRALEQMGRQANVTLFILIQAIYADFLSRYSGQRDLTIGSPVAGRHREELEPLIGFFVNMLVFRVNLQPEPGKAELSVTELVTRVRDTVFGVFSHQDMPFERLVDQLVPQRDPGYNPLFQVALVWQQALIGDVSLAGLHISTLEQERHAAKFDLTLEMDVQDGCLQGSFHYRVDLFEAETVAAMARHLGQLLRAYAGTVSEMQDCPITSLTMLDAEEHRRLLYTWNDTEVIYPQDSYIQQRFADQARRTSKAIALRFARRSFSYEEIECRANRLAQELSASGAGAEVRIITHLERSPEWIVALLAILKAGAVYVPTDPAHPTDRLGYILADSGSVLILGLDQHLEKLELPDRVTRISLDTLFEKPIEQTDPAYLSWQDPARPAYIIYTSGTTGRPKGVVVTHAGLMNLALGQSRHFAVTARSRVAQMAALSFDASISELIMTWAMGACLCLGPAEQLLPGPDLARFCDEHGVTHITMTPSALTAMPSGSLKTVETLITAGEACGPELVAVWSSGRRFINAYGPTEVSVCASMSRPLLPGQRITIGLPMDNVRAYVVDRAFHLVPPGVPGELVIASPGLARGYLNQPMRSATAFVPNPFSAQQGKRLYRTGDLVRHCRKTGELLFLGRIDHQVKINGIRIEPGEIEHCLQQHPGVRECLVHVREETGKKQLIGYVIPHQGGEDRESYAAFLTRDLPRYMVPTVFVTLDQWPLTPNGKLDKAALPAPASANTTEHVAPTNDTERKLAAIWADVLGLERVGIYDNFFALGGDSILSIQVVSRAREVGLDLSVADLFQHQTIARLALDVAALDAQAAVAPHDGPAPLTPIQDWFFNLAGPHHRFNQSIMLRVPRGLDPLDLARALTHIVEVHEALRFQFECTKKGIIRVAAERQDELQTLEQLDLSELHETDQVRAIAEHGDRLQGSLNPWNGKLYRFAYFDLGPNRAAQLLLIIHHLVVDGVSWRVIMQDLVTTTAQIQMGQKPRLAVEATPFSHWANRLRELAQAPEIVESLPTWIGLHEGVTPSPVTDLRQNTAARSGSVRVSLGKELTENLLRKASSAYHTEINDLLLCALARALKAWKPERYNGPQLLALEGHGREALFPELDLSRTVGWFTALYPIRLEPPQDLPGAIKAVKEQLRALPHKGLSYGLLRYLNPATAHRLSDLPTPDIAFNYLGQFSDEQGDWTTAEGEQGDVFAPEWIHPYLMQVLAMCLDGQLSVSWIFGHAYFSETEIETLANGFIAELSDIIRHCIEPAHGGHTPSDFPLARLSMAEVVTLEHRFDAIEDVFPLAPLQEGLWFHTLYQPESTLYFEQARLALEGDLDEPAFRLAWQQVLDRHAALRVVPVSLEGRRPLQVVLAKLELPWSRHDWTHLSGIELEKELESYLAADRARGFGQGPLLRFSLIKTGPREHVFVFSFHHMLMDGWSSPIVFHDFLTLYKAHCKGTRERLPVVRPYRDYIKWLAERDRDEARDFWRGRLGDVHGPTPLPTIPGTPKRGEQIEVYEVRLDRECTAALEAYAREQHLTPNILAIAAWALLLARYSGEDDVVFGTTVSGRAIQLAGITEMVGLFINTLPVRVQLQPHMTVVDLLKAIQSDSLAREDFAYAPLHEIGAWSGIAAGASLFETMVVFENYPSGEETEEDEAWPGKLYMKHMTVAEHVHYPLSLAIGPDEAWLFKLAYDPSCYTKETVSRIAEHLLQMQRALCQMPRLPVLQLPMLGDEERRQLLDDFNDSGTNDARDLLVYQLFERQAQTRPDATALIHSGGTISYGELHRRASQLATLLAFQVEAETPVASLLERSPEMIIAFLAILQVGAVYVPLAPKSPPERLSYILADTGCKLVLTKTNLLAEVDLPIGMDPILLDDESIWQGSQQKQRVQPHLQQLAYIIYTSGSTGKPKGVGVTHRGLVNLAKAQSRHFAVDGNSRVALVASPIFDASISEIIMTWPHGAALCLDAGERLMPGPELAAFVDEHAISHITLTPTVLAAMPEDSLSSVTTLITAGEACQAELVEQWGVRRRMINAFGPTESTVCATMSAPMNVGQPITIGLPMENTRVHVVDALGQLVPALVPGELLIQSPGLARGYLNRPAQTAAAFIPDAFGEEAGGRLYRSGDLVRRLSDGTLDFIGRIDHQVKIRGIRIEPGEIEKALLAHEKVVYCSVLPHGEGAHKQLVAAVVPERETPELVGELRTYLGQNLPEYMVPGLFLTLESLPLNNSGKTDRKALSRIISEHRAQRKCGSAADNLPKTGIQQRLIELWREVLEVADVGLDDNFFDLGGHSLLMVSLQTRLQELTGPISLVTLFQYPSIRALASYLEPATETKPQVVSRTTQKPAQMEIAVIGYALRVPGAGDANTFWCNLRDGVESVIDLSEEVHLAAGMDPVDLADPHFVTRGAVLEGIELFDAAFFGISPGEAEITDPQHRIFLECTWEALEHAGYASDTGRAEIGLYAGVSMNGYRTVNLPNGHHAFSAYQIHMVNDRDFLPTRVSYKLNLRGPSINVQSSCSSSLTAIHLAARSIMAGDCPMALAGGVSVNVQQQFGYYYQPGMVQSPDGHCRAFDARAAGTVGGSGVGVVLLKGLDDALADGDTVHAVLKGSAMNNDGSDKVGYTAPGVSGQEAVIREALAVAGVDSETVGYVEAHGTGTTLGDPIEITALTRAFDTRQTPCPIGSVKTNIGHLDAAAGVAGFLKTVLSLKHRQLAPSLHYETPNPNIDFEGSPFYVNAQLAEWSSPGPRRAGVSSFGIGGTNVHAVLEEAPVQPQTRPDRTRQLLLLSAKSATALQTNAERLAAYLRQDSGVNLEDLAYTLQVGRAHFEHRRALVVSDVADAIEQLGRLGSGHRVGQGEGPVAFMFPGQGSQHINMCLGVEEPVYQRELTRCVDFLRDLMGLDLRELLYGEADDEAAAERLRRTEITQPALFAVSYALAQQWLAWGIQPGAFIGHSIGEYVAACLAGVFSLEDALRLVAERGRLMGRLPVGAMLAVPLAEAELESHLGNDLDLAAVNGQSQTVVSGTVEAIDTLAAQLAKRDIETRRLHTDHAFHSHMTLALMEPFRKTVESVVLQAPRIPFVSNVTGTWITEEQATDPAYWALHMREAVRFHEGLSTLLADETLRLLEVGPGRTLTTLASRHPDLGEGRTVLSSQPHPRSGEAKDVYLLARLGEIWSHGAAIQWTELYPQQRRRIPLPTYAFDHKRFWIEPPEPGQQTGRSVEIRKETDQTRWFHVPSWKRLPLAPSPEPVKAEWLVFSDGSPLAKGLLKRLRADSVHITVVETGDQWMSKAKTRWVRAGERDDYTRLAESLKTAPDHVLHLWNLGESEGLDMDRSFFSLIYLVQALTTQFTEATFEIVTVANRVHEVSGEQPKPENALLLGPNQVIPQEYPGIRTRLIDVDLTGHEAKATQELLLRELGQDQAPSVVALRHGHRWQRTYERGLQMATTAQPVAKKGGVYLITGGLGGIGYTLARHLAETPEVRLILTTRQPLPPSSEWPELMARRPADDALSVKLSRLKTLSETDARVDVVAVDVCDASALVSVLGEDLQLDGIIHAAGQAGAGTIYLKTREKAEAVLAPKVQGTRNLLQLIEPKGLDFFVVCSSLASILGGLGQVDYTAANAYTDSLATHLRGEGVCAFSINWDTWLEVGMASAGVDEQRIGIRPEEGVRAFEHVLAGEHPQVLVSVVDLEQQQQLQHSQTAETETEEAGPQHPRPDLAVAYRAPRAGHEQTLIDIWQRLLGIDGIGVDDDFFALGGDSLLATRLMHQLRKIHNITVPLQTILQAPTPAAQATLLTGLLEGGTDQAREVLEEQTVADNLVALRKQGSATPMYWVHPVGGHILCYRELAQGMGEEQPFYAFFAEGLEGDSEPLTRIEAMAERYLAQLEVYQPEGPVILAGWSLGGVVAFEMARRLSEQGREVERVVLLDSYVGEALGRGLSETDLLVEFGADLGVLFEPREIGRLDHDQLMDELLQRTRDRGKLGKEMHRAALARLFHVFKKHVEALTSYEPQSFPGEISFYHVAEHDPASLAIWRKLAETTTHQVAGNHFTMLQPPNLIPLSKAIHTTE